MCSSDLLVSPEPGEGEALPEGLRTSGTRLSSTSDAETVRHPVEVVEESDDGRELDDAVVVEADGAEPVEVRTRHGRGRSGQLLGVRREHLLALGQRGAAPVRPHGFVEGLVLGHQTQKLCVRLQSIEAVVGLGHDAGDELLLAPREG